MPKKSGTRPQLSCIARSNSRKICWRLTSTRTPASVSSSGPSLPVTHMRATDLPGSVTSSVGRLTARRRPSASTSPMSTVWPGKTVAGHRSPMYRRPLTRRHFPSSQRGKTRRVRTYLPTTQNSISSAPGGMSPQACREPLVLHQESQWPVSHHRQTDIWCKHGDRTTQEWCRDTHLCRGGLSQGPARLQRSGNHRKARHEKL